jgi:putative DNA primase/helicase
VSVALDHARAYLSRGWRVIPVPFQSKKPTITGWPALRLDEGDLAQLFNGQPSNIGTLLGEPSGGLTDVDLDCPEAVRLAPRFLPMSRSLFGRANKRRSHWLYYAGPVVSTEKFEDLDGAMLVELRSTGAQTVFPGSVHECGEPIEWDEDGEVARGSGATLRQAVAQLAATCLLARHWPGPGARHDASLAAAGLLARGGLDEALCVLVIQAAAEAAGDGEARERRRDVTSTVARIAAGEAVTGGPTLERLLTGDGAGVVRRLRDWLGIRRAGHELSDVASADRFVAQHGEAYRYVYRWHQWVHFAGGRWQPDDGALAMRDAKATARGWFADVQAATTDEARKALAKWALYSNSEPGLRRMLTLAQSELAIPPDQFDADPWLLNCPNGTLELRTGHLRRHRREDFLTKMTAAPYDPAARSDTWDSFLEANVREADTITTLQRFAGYSVTGDTSEDRSAFLYGPGGSGKSTMLEAIRRTLGDYAETASFETFLHHRRDPSAPNDDVARLRGARMVIAVETEGGRAWAAGIVKHHSGGDSIRARHLHQASFTFTPQYKLWFAANDRPRVDATDDAFWRRLFEVPFPVGRPDEAQRDPTIRARLVDPAQSGAAILAWAVEGCAAWLAQGLGISPGIREATKAYRVAMDTVAQFLADRCLLDPGGSTAAQSLRVAYETWCREDGIRPATGKAWSAPLEAAGLDRTRLHGGKTYWIGVQLLDQAEPDWVKGEPR